MSPTTLHGRTSPNGAPISAAVAPRALGIGDFRRVAENGFGDGSNSYAYSSVWHDGRLYVGSNREILPLLIMRSPFTIPFAVPPVPVPNDYTDLDIRGQIWRYDPDADRWERVYHSPLVEGFEGRLVPQAFGFRSMTVFQGASDPRPAIYTIPVVGRNALESVTLRSLDGTRFEPLPAPRVRGSNDVFGSFRAMVAFKGRLFVAPSASKPKPEALRVEDGREVHITHVNTSRESAVLSSADPASGDWQLSSQPLFGDLTNASIIDMAVCGEFLYVGTLNVRHGFQLWRTRGEGAPPYEWELVIDRGADRGAYNQAVLSMAEFNGDLYVGTCIQNGGYDRVYHIGPAAGEVLRVRPDKSWDLVVGDPRLTRQGLKVPTSGIRSGFGNPLNGYIWRMCAHAGALYVGTCDVSSFVPFSRDDLWPEHIRRLLDNESMDRYLERLGGCELWRTTDGDNWAPVTRNGFGNPYNLGVRTLVSTPRGLFVGTANPFGPKVAVRTATGWEYLDNPRGGLEVWLGATEHRTQPARRDAILPTRAAAPADLRRNGKAGHDTAAPLTNGDAPLSPADLLDEHSLLERELIEQESLRNPLLRLAATPSDLVGLNETVEDELEGYFGGPLRNVGYWRSRSLSPQQAAQALVEELCVLAPEEWNEHPCSLLVIGSAASELGDILQSRLPLAEITATPPDELAKGREAEYDGAIVLEVGAELRREVLNTIAIALKPDACVLFADCLPPARAPDMPGAAIDQSDPLALFEADVKAAGLHLNQCHDVTASTWVPFFDHSRNYWLVKLLFGQIDQDTHSALLAALPGGNGGVHSYVFARAVPREVT